MTAGAKHAETRKSDFRAVGGACTLSLWPKTQPLKSAEGNMNQKGKKVGVGIVQNVFFLFDVLPSIEFKFLFLFVCLFCAFYIRSTDAQGSLASQRKN